MRERNRSTLPWRGVVAAGLLAGLLGLAACGSDTQVTYDCCLNSVWYVCNSSQAYGQCLPYNYQPNPSGCTRQGGACPSNSNQ